jgi:hypothetical protein
MAVYLHNVLRWFNRLDRQEWVVVLVVGMVFGFLCMRGYGSRSNY